MNVLTMTRERGWVYRKDRETGCIGKKEKERSYRKEYEERVMSSYYASFQEKLKASVVRPSPLR